jgi:predicted membrane-bound spermidine synthase
MQKISLWKVALLLFVSGFCALVYQVVWLRELGLVFGSATAATGMVLAVFMAGLGGGAVYLGKVVDRLKNPLAFYGFLELGITAGAALSPLFIFLIRKLYLALGGSMAMGLPIATLVRIIFSALILLIPTAMMGGTLPAAARAMESAGDRGRRNLAILYGFNTLGGVLGVGLATFIFLEILGNQATLWLGCLCNGLVGAMALLLARQQGVGPSPAGRAPAAGETGETEIAIGGPSGQAVVPRTVVYGAAFLVGFCFLLMELVWYRMLGPLLGGSTFTFGLILAVALAGIGIGSGIFGMGRREVRTTISAFALICGLEALFMGIPFALGDRLAILTALLKPLAAAGFHAQLLGWLLVAAIVVLPAAIMAGIQFPMLIGLLGQGQKDVGCHTGYVYGWNTGGAIAGSLAGGFGLIPLFTAPVCWQVVIALLLLLSLGALVLAIRIGNSLAKLLPVTAVLLAALLLLIRADGPSAVWRHSAISATHNVDLGAMNSNQIREWQNGVRRQTVWEQEGIESSVALLAYDGLSFVVNGKSDGHVIGDAGMQVMGPLVGAILHPDPKRGLVIGLGTGSSAGWLAEVSTMERVDVVEIEPAILEVARRCSPVNFNVLEHPKTNVIIADGRELIQTSEEKYDVILSEPSNPYRAGIANLYTREFYQAVENRLAAGGYFSQWVQGYYIDGQTVRTIIATLSSVFKNVEIWLLSDGDLLFVCSMKDRPYPLPLIRRKVAEEPFRSALYKVWGVSGVEGLLGAYLGRPEVSRGIAEQESEIGRINTDDRMLAEFAFARTVGRTGLFSADKLRMNIRERNLHRPVLDGGSVDWTLVDENFFRIMLWSGKKISNGEVYGREQTSRRQIYQGYFLDGNFQMVLRAWQDGLLDESCLLELAMLAETLAEFGDERAVEMAGRVKELWPASGDGIMARYLFRSGEYEKSFAYLATALEGFRERPWQVRAVVAHSLALAMEMAGNNFHSREIFILLKEPFSVYQFEEYRKFALLQVGKAIDYHHAAEALAQWEPSIPWKEPILEFRLACYKAIDSPLTGRAERELAQFLAAEPPVVLGPSVGQKYLN